MADDGTVAYALIVDADEIVQWASPGVYELVGDPSVVQGHGLDVINRLAPGVPSEELAAAWRECVAGSRGVTSTLDVPVVLPSGARLVVDVTFTNMLDVPPVGAVVVIVTVPDAEPRARSREEAHLRTALDAGRIGVWRWDLARRTVRWSAAAAELFGYPAVDIEVPDLAWIGKIHPSEVDEIDQYIRRMVRSGDRLSLTYRIITVDGATRWVENHGEPFFVNGRVAGTVGITFDVTREMADALEMADTNARFRLALDAARLGTWTFDLAHGAGHGDAAAEEILGLADVTPGAPMAGGILEAAVDPLDLSGIRAAWQRTVLTGRDLAHRFRIRRATDGEHRWVEVHARRAVDTTGTADRLIGTIADVTDERARADALAASEERFRHLIHQGTDITAIVERDRVVTYVNAAGRLLLGTNEGDRWDRTGLNTFVHDADVDQVDDALGRVIAGATTATVTFRAFHSGGSTELWFDGQWTNRRTVPGIHGVVFHARNITDRVAAEQALSRANTVLERANNDVRQALSRLERARHDERARIAADLHDDMVQSLAALRLRALSSGLGPAGRTFADDLDQVIADVRQVIQGLRDRSTEARPLVEVLRSLAAASATTRYLGPASLAAVPAPIEHVAARVFAEAFRNAQQHAVASRIEIHLHATGSRLIGAVLDDGIGFDPERAEARRAGGHVGLVLMADWAGSTGGSLVVGAGLDGRGCGVRFELPFDGSDQVGVFADPLPSTRAATTAS